MASIRTAKPYVATRICRIGCSTGSSRGTRTVAEGPIALRKPSLATRSFSSSSSSSSQPVMELREDFLIPRHATSYFEAVSEHYSGAAAPAPPPNLCFLSRQELGGDANVATHAYCYQGGLTELQEKRKIIENDNGLQGFDDLQSYILSQRSSVYVEAPLVNEQSDYVVGLGNTTKTVADNDDDNDDDDDDNNDCIFELRRYHLKLGYDTVPKFLDLYGAGLPSKLRAPGTDPRTGLVTLLYSEVGRLNEVIEIWRHGNGVPGMEQSRVAARKANEWRGAIANIADLAIEFHSTIHRPVWTALPPSKKK